MFASVAHAMGTAGAGQAGGADALMQFVPLIAMLAIFYFLLIRPQQKRAKHVCSVTLSGIIHSESSFSASESGSSVKCWRWS